MRSPMRAHRSCERSPAALRIPVAVALAVLAAVLATAHQQAEPVPSKGPLPDGTGPNSNPMLRTHHRAFTAVSRENDRLRRSLAGCHRRANEPRDARLLLRRMAARLAALTDTNARLGLDNIDLRRRLEAVTSDCSVSFVPKPNAAPPRVAEHGTAGLVVYPMAVPASGE